LVTESGAILVAVVAVILLHEYFLKAINHH